MKIKRTITETIDVPDEFEIEDAMAMLANPDEDGAGDDDDDDTEMDEAEGA